MESLKIVLMGKDFELRLVSLVVRARELANDDRCGPNTAWDAPFCTVDEVYSVEEEDIEEWGDYDEDRDGDFGKWQ